MVADKSRFFSDLYDSVFQRSYYNLVKEDFQNRYRYLGKLRLDGLLSEKVVLLDTQLLDGAFFLDRQNNPSDIFDKLSRGEQAVHPLEIRARDYDLSNTILGFVKDKATNRIKNFSFSSIVDPNERKRAAELLQATPYHKIEEVKDIIQKFKEAGVDPDNINSIEEAWGRWAELPSHKGLIIAKQEREKGFPINEFIKPQDEFLRDVTEQEVKEEGEWIIANLNKRSDIDQRLEEKKKMWDQQKTTQLTKLVGRYHVAYDKTVAWQSNCPMFESMFNTVIDWLDLEQIKIADIDQDISLDKLIEIKDIDPYFFFKLGIMPNHMYEAIFYENMRDIESWWYHRDYGALQRFVEKVVDKIISTKEIPEKKIG